MDEYLRLGTSDVAAERPFTHPARTAEDLVSIQRMLAALRRALAVPSALPARPRPLVLSAPDPSGRQHRVIICDDRRLRARRDLALVGFFALKRPGLDASPLTAMDDELIREFPAHPGILSYSSLELADANWGNLIALDPPDARERWRESEKHAYAARELAPQHYMVVRLHNLALPGGLPSRRNPALVRTTYYDYQGHQPWRAKRELPPS